jgi:hypothetical protein
MPIDSARTLNIRETMAAKRELPETILAEMASRPNHSGHSGAPRNNPATSLSVTGTSQPLGSSQEAILPSMAHHAKPPTIHEQLVANRHENSPPPWHSAVGIVLALRNRKARPRSDFFPLSYTNIPQHHTRPQSSNHHPKTTQNHPKPPKTNSNHVQPHQAAARPLPREDRAPRAVRAWCKGPRPVPKVPSTFLTAYCGFEQTDS